MSLSTLLQRFRFPDKILQQLDWSPIQSYYDDCATHIEDNGRAMGWQSQFTQRLRFDVMSYLVDFTDQSVLDIGCGAGGLFHYLTDLGIPFNYSGIDLSQKMVRRAIEDFPGLDVRVANFLTYEPNNPIDVVVASGTFSYCPEGIDPYVFLKSCLKKCLSLSSRHVVVNLLTSHAEPKSQLFQRYDPEKVLKLAFQLTPYVTLNHSYLPNDFTILLTK